MTLFKSRYTVLVTVVLLLQTGAYYTVLARGELTPTIVPLEQFPTTLGQWQMQQDIPLEKEIKDLLRADDTLNRVYTNPQTAAPIYFFVGFFKTQRYLQSPHSPKNCLPGAGWEPLENTTMQINVPEWNGPITSNKYVVSHGDQKSVVLYWYQSHNRIIPSEYTARFWLVMDAIRYRRSDTSIVKVTIPVIDNNIEAATQTGVQFIQTMFPTLLRRLPA